MTARRALSLAVIALMIVALLPLPALAKPGGNGHGNGRGMQAGATFEHGQGKGHKAVAGLETSGTPDVRIPPGQAKKHRSFESSGSTEGTAPVKLTGIANALSRIQRNLARMQAQLDAGQRTALPAGLLSVVEKFMAWLGITPEPSSTPVPTSTVEPTVTVEPTATP